jgi:hypothetical protein
MTSPGLSTSLCGIIGSPVLLVARDQRRVGLGGEVAGKARRAIQQGHGTTSLEGCQEFGSVYSWISRSFCTLRPASDRKVHCAPTEARNSLHVRMLSVEMVTIWV